MANTIQLKRSAVQGNVPTTAQLALGEIGINTYDGKVFIKKDNGTPAIVEVGGSSTLDGLTDVTITTPSEGQILWHNGTGWINSPATGAREVFTATASQTVFTTANSYVVGAGQLSVYLNGVKQYPDSYTETSTTSFTLDDPSVAGDLVMAEIGILTSGYVPPPSTVALDDLTDVVVNALATDDVLIYDGTNWVNAAASAGIVHQDGLANMFGPSPTMDGSFNTAYGDSSLAPTGGGSNNTSYGYYNLSGTTGSYNTAVGARTLAINTTGSNNTAVGEGALLYNTTAAYNVAVGASALISNTTGQHNTATGTGSVSNNVTGNDNTGIGYLALAGSGSTVDATAIVAGVSYTIQTVGTTDFTLIGAATNTVGVIFTASGAGAGTGQAVSNTNNNTAIGYGAGSSIISGSNNTMIGGYIGTPGMADNVILSTGIGGIRLRVDELFNTSVGVDCMAANTTGISNVAVGESAMMGNTTGYENVGIGSYPLYQNTTGYANVGIGVEALANNTVGTDNTAVGAEAAANTDAIDNTAIGAWTLYSATSGDGNTAVGRHALYSSTTGANNVAIGHLAGTDAVATITTQSNYIVLGNNDTTNANIKVAWTVTSDGRDKTDIVDIPSGLDLVNLLQPKRFKLMDRATQQPTTGDRYGFIAQDILPLEAQNPVLVDNADPDNLKLKESMLVPLLVKAIQELTAQNQTLSARITALESQ